MKRIYLALGIGLLPILAIAENAANSPVISDKEALGQFESDVASLPWNKGLPLLANTAENAADTSTIRQGEVMGRFTGAVKPALEIGEVLSAFFSIDQSYCGPPLAVPTDCPQYSQGPSLNLMFADVQSILSAAVFSDPLDMLTKWPSDLVADYKKALGIAKNKSLFALGPQDVNVANVIPMEFATLSFEQQKAIQLFYENLEKRSQKFVAKIPQGKMGLERYPNIFLGDKISNVLDENSKPLEPGWLWREALAQSKNDTRAAIQLLSYCGASPTFWARMNWITEMNFRCPKVPLLLMSQAASEKPSLPADLEAKIKQVNEAVDDRDSAGHPLSLYINNKSYHFYSAAYVACHLAAQAHPKERIVSVEKAMASAYVDFTFRHKVCRKAKYPMKEDAHANVADDATALLGFIRRNEGSTDQKMALITNFFHWNPIRFEKAKTKANQWLLDWDWTIAQHEAGAEWGFEMCKNKK